MSDVSNSEVLDGMGWQRDTVLPAGWDGSVSVGDLLGPDEGGDLGSDDRLLEASAAWLDADGPAVGDFLGEGSLSESRGLDQKFADAAASAISLARGGRRLASVGRKSLAITVEDFELGAQRDAFLIIEANKLAIFSKGLKNRLALVLALQFFFGLPTDDRVCFDDCCEVLESRPDVVLLRLQYEFFLSGKVFTRPFPFLTRSVPQRLVGPISFAASRYGMHIAREVWVQPGITTEELTKKLRAELSVVDVGVLAKELSRLEDEYLLSHEFGWYLTGRCPQRTFAAFADRMHRLVATGGSVHWSALFGD